MVSIRPGKILPSPRRGVRPPHHSTTGDHTTRAREGTPRLDGRAEKRLAEGAQTRDAPSRLTTAPAPAARTLPALGILRPGPPVSVLRVVNRVFFLKSSPSKRARLNARGPVMCSIPDPHDPTVLFTGDRTGHTRRHGCQDAAGGSGREAPEAGAPGLLPDHGGHEGLVREVHRVHRGGHRGVWNRSDRAPGGLDPASGGVRQHRLHRGPTHQAGKRQTRAERHALMRKATRFLFLPEASNTDRRASPPPVSQHATGRKGLFRTLLVEQKPLSIKNDFKPAAMLKENLPSEAALKDTSVRSHEKNTTRSTKNHRTFSTRLASFVHFPPAHPTYD